MSDIGVRSQLDSYYTKSSWTSYKERMEFYFEANSVTDDSKKKAIFIFCLKEEVYEIIRSLTRPQTPKDFTFIQIIEKLDAHFNPSPNEIVQRFNFHRRQQAPDKSIAVFVNDLRKLSEFCIFQELENMLRDRIVCGVTDSSLQKRLFAEPNLDFKKAYGLAIAHEAASRSSAGTQVHEEKLQTSEKPQTKELLSLRRRRS